MKSIVFTFARRNSRTPVRRNYSSAGLFLKRYGATVLFVFVYACGLLFGSLSARGSDAKLLDGLNFLFTTNLSARMDQPVFSTFATSFASDFLFLLFVFLCGLSPWGMAVTFVGPAFKGFGVGLSAGYLFVTYGLKGVGFYLLVILAGTFIFSFALVIECIQANELSCRIAKMIFFSGESVQPVSSYVHRFLLRSFYMLLLSAVAAVIDMLLWTGFSGVFF